ncbi:hypothetical protein [uncultured Maribacter sp.]|uniref:HEAT repeat domain-containing protein n=1 Tax=uncultured Maribacter sp. TaxID=431308 RepID=UPI0030EEB8B8
MIPPRQIKITLITAPEFNLDYLWWLSILFMVLAVLYFVGIFFIRNRINAINGRTRDKKVEFSPMINEFLFYEDSNSKEEKMNYLNLKIQIRELIKEDFDRNVLTEVLLDLRKDLSGQSQTVLIDLYKDLGLHNDAYEKLSSRRWQIVSSGILELTSMDVKESYGLIIKFINHRQGTIRKQAEIAVVNLKEEGIGYFLDNTKYKISEWQQLKLLDVLRHKPNFEPPLFGLWLTSTNSHVVLFSLRLIKYYKQSNTEQSIVTLLKHKKRDVQSEAIDCIKEFFFISALPTLKMVYGKASNDIKIAILDAIGEIGSKSDLTFLEGLKNKEKNFNVKNKIVGTLNKLDPESILPTKNIAGSDYFSSELENNEDDSEVPASIDNEIAVELPVTISNNIIEVKDDVPVEETSEPIIEEEIVIINSDENSVHIKPELNEIISITDSEVPASIDNEIAVELPVTISKNIIEVKDNVPVEETSEPIIEEEIVIINSDENSVPIKPELNEINSITDNDVIEENNIVEQEPDDDLISEIDLTFLPKINNNVIEEDVNIQSHIENTQEEEKELTFEFLPLIISNVIVEERITNDEQEDFVPLFSLDDDIDIECNDIEHENDIAPEDEIKEIDWSSISIKSSIDANEDVETSKEPLVSFENDTVTFSANFIEQDELDTMVLLENIAEMGDCRELPILHELLADTTSPLILERITELIQKFSYQSPRPNALFSSKNDLAESVFTEIYNLSDNETKFILLEEIKRIGDEKEIQLLETVIETESKALAKSAKSVLKHIKSQIALTNVELKTTDENEDPLFDVDFELGFSEASRRMMNSNENGSTLFDHLCSMSNTLYNKING